MWFLVKQEFHRGLTLLSRLTKTRTRPLIYFKYLYRTFINLFTTSDPTKYSNSNSPILCFCLLKGDKKTFSLVQKIFSTNKNVFLSPFNKQKQRFEGFEFKYFGGSNVANKLQGSNTRKRSYTT